MTTPNAAVYRNTSEPSWGLGLVIEDLADRWVIVFETAGRKTFIKGKAKTLEPAEVEPEALEALKTKLQGKGASRASTQTKAKGKAKAKAPKKAGGQFASFEAQLALFEKLFPGGFEGETFINDERGAEGATGKLGHKTAAIALTRAELSPERFDSAPPDEVFESARRILGATNIVFPIEGAIPFGGIAEEDRPAALAALKDLLHGQDDYGARLERFVAALNLKDKSGKVKKVTWPLATVFGALWAPDQHTCVKPTAFAAQGALLGSPVPPSQPVTAEGYRQFFEIAKETQKRLLDAGQRPRDLVDVYSFIWRTHAEKPAPAPGPAPEA